ncbi:NAD-dependent epimerase/dehydratase family protein [Nocardia rhamnosiphila]|uniref:NAD-dependent epimerase/dehydratase family protein n=1 Tax=Nocardia rhamnosiphila TaxID=426716 RepID=UPI00340864AD
MQTVLDAGGPIADELVNELHRNYTTDIRLVSRKPSHVNDTDELVAADLTDAEATSRAVAGSQIAYLTVGLPLDSGLWERRFPVIMGNVIDACAEHGTKLVFFDNTYMYPGTSAPQTESTAFAPGGRKGRVRGELATMLLAAMRAGRVQGLIGRAPEFYGPGSTKSYTNSLVFDRIRAGKRPFVPVNAHTERSLIWTPDASRALALLGKHPGCLRPDVAPTGRPEPAVLRPDHRDRRRGHRPQDRLHGADRVGPPITPRFHRRYDVGVERYGAALLMEPKGRRRSNGILPAQSSARA